MAVTIYDIAKQVNTSAVTVSLALRNSKRVGAATKKKIQQTAQELGYQPNPLARGLVGAKTNTFAFVFNYPSEHFAHDLSYMELFHAIAQVLSAKDYKIFVHTSTTARAIHEVYAEVRPYRVDGMILGTHIANEQEREILEKAPIPTILLGRDFHSKRVTGLVYGCHEGACLAVKHFLKLGHRRIAFTGKNNNETSVRRFGGYISTMTEVGLKIEEKLIIESGWDVDAGENAGIRLAGLSEPPTAVLAGTDMMAIGVIAGLKRKGLEVPKDVSVVGFDNLHISRFSIPSLSSVDLRRDLIAKNAVEDLIQMVENDSEGRRIVIPSELVLRDSTSECKNFFSGSY